MDAAGGARAELRLRLAALAALRARARGLRFEVRAGAGPLALRLLAPRRALYLVAVSDGAAGGDAAALRGLLRARDEARRAGEAPRLVLYSCAPAAEGGADADAGEGEEEAEDEGAALFRTRGDARARRPHAPPAGPLLLRGQGDAAHVHALLRAEVARAFGRPLALARRVAAHLLEALRPWARGGAFALATAAALHCDLGAAVARALRERARRAPGRAGLAFRRSACRELRAALRGGDPLRVCVPGVRAGLRAAKLLQVLREDFPGQWLLVDGGAWRALPEAALAAACASCLCVALDADAPAGALQRLRGGGGPARVVEVCACDGACGGALRDLWGASQLTRAAARALLARALRPQSPPAARDLWWEGAAAAEGGVAEGGGAEGGGAEGGRAEGAAPACLRRLPGSATPWGFEYEFKLCGLVALRARRAGLRFQVFSNARAARPFDDVVLRVLAPRPALYCVQLKHSCDAKALTERDFSPKRVFDMRKHFEFFKRLRALHAEGGGRAAADDDERLLAAGRFQDARFVFYTTREAERRAPRPPPPDAAADDDHHFCYEDLFLAGGDAFCFVRQDQEVWDLLEGDPSSDIYREEFLRRLRVMSGQSVSDDLDAFIRYEITNLFGGAVPHADRFLAEYLSFLREWALDDAQGSCICDASPQLHMEGLLAEQLRARARAAAGGLLAFQEAACAELRAALDRAGEEPLRVAVHGVPPGLRSAKLLQLLDELFPARWALVDDAVLREFPTAALEAASRACALLAWDVARAQPGARELRTALRGRLRVVELLPGDAAATHLSERWALEQLQPHAQELFLDRALLFQGTPLPLRALEGAWPQLRAEADGALLSALACGDAALGAPPPAPPAEGYVPPTLQHCNVLRASALSLHDPGEHLALSGFPRSELQRLHAQLRADGGPLRNDRWTALGAEAGAEAGADEAAFARVCEERRGRSVHWVQRAAAEEGAPGGAALLWRRTRGRPDALAEHVLAGGGRCARAPQCAHAGAAAAADAAAWRGGAALLVGEAGAGKSSFLRRAAAEARALQPAGWAVLVELLAHRALLRRWPPSAEMRLEDAEQLVAAAAGVAAPASCEAAARRCLGAALRRGGRVRLFVDGVDEVCPHYTRKVLRALQLLGRARGAALWVSSRPELEAPLRRALGCAPARLLPFSAAAQSAFLCGAWARVHALPPSAFAAAARDLVAALGGDRGLLRAPLHARMAAEAFAQEALEAQRDGRPLLQGPADNLLALFSRFVHLKRELYLERHGLKAANIENLFIEDKFDLAHQQCAMFVLLSEESYSGVDTREFDECVAENARFVAREKTGLLWREPGGQLRFAHHSLVEFFAAAWLRANAASHTARCVLRALFAREPGARLRVFLELALAQGRPLHLGLLAGGDAGLRAALAAPDAGRRLHAQDAGGRLALHVAAGLGLDESVRALLQGGSRPDGPDALLGWTPLRYADAVLQARPAGEGRWLRVAERLLRAGADRTQLEGGARACDLLSAVSLDLPLVAGRALELAGEGAFAQRLAAAVAEWSPQCVERLLQCGARALPAWPRALRPPPQGYENATKCDQSHSPDEVQHPVHTAVRRGDLDILDALLRHGADVEARDGRGDTALHAAAALGQVRAVHVLTRGGADANAGNTAGETPLHVAANEGLQHVLESLLEAGAQADARDAVGNTALHVAAAAGREGTAKYLLERRADPNGENFECCTALHVAAEKGFLQVVKALLEGGANINARNKDGNTALHLSALKAHDDCVQFLLENGLQVEERGRDGCSPLLCSAQEGALQVMQTLLRVGASSDARDKDGDTALHLAALGGNDGCVKLLLEKGLHVNEKGIHGYTPFHYATRACSLQVMQTLCAAGAKCDARDEFGNTALHIAAYRGHDDCIEFLQEKGLLTNDRGYEGYTPLHYAAQGGFLQVMQTLLRAGAGIDSRDDYGDTALHLAALDDHDDCVKLLLEYGLQVDDKGHKGSSPLHYAAQQSSLRVMQTLLGAGARSDVRDDNGNTPLDIAAFKGHDDCVRFLLENGSRVDDAGYNGSTVLHKAAREGSLQVMQTLLRAGAKADARDDYGDTALHIAALRDHDDCVKFLLENGLRINDKGSNGYLPLHHAAQEGSLQVMQTLLGAGAKCNARDGYGNTALHITAYRGHDDCMAFLLEKGSSVNDIGYEGFTPLHYAAQGGFLQAMQTLLRSGARIDVRDDHGDTPLHVSAAEGREACVKFLVENGSHINSKGCQGFTPLHYASREDCLPVLQTLLHLGASTDVRDNNGDTALHVAVQHGRLASSEFLVKMGLDSNAKGRTGFTPAHYAAQEGFLFLLEALHRAGATCYLRDDSGDSPLHLAASRGHQDCVRYLLLCRADVIQKGRGGRTALHHAAKGGHLLAMETLLRAGATCSARDEHKDTPLHLAAQDGHEDCVKSLLAVTLNVNDKGCGGARPLHHAARGGSVGVMRALLSAGAKIDARDDDGNTALHEAVLEGREDTVQFLLENGSPVNDKGHRGSTPLHHAAERGSLGVMRALLRAGAKRDAKNRGGKTPLQVAPLHIRAICEDLFRHGV